MKKTEIARKYRNQYGIEMPTLKLARIIYAKENLSFKDVEDVRWTLRSIEGKAGDKKTIVTHEYKERKLNPYKLPESDESSFEPYIIKGFNRLLLFCDIHAPYHSMSAITAAIEYSKKEKPDCIVINGDLFDFHKLSKYIKEPQKKNFAEEISIGCQLLNVLKKQFNTPIIFKLGNHDERYQHFLWTKSGELAGIDDFELETIIKKRVSDITVINDKRIIKAGDLNIVHGHEFATSIMSPVNIARGLYLRAKANTICGHHHRTSEHTEQNINGKIVTTWSVGCLSELHPQYMPINSWNHGFAIIDLHGSKEFEVRNKRIWKGKIL